MLEIDKLRKLTVGDLVEFQRHKKEERKREIIESVKSLHGDAVPESALAFIENQLKQIPKVEDSDALGLEEIQYLVWMSMRKSDADITLKQVGEHLNTDKLQDYVNAMLPQADTVPTKKKTVKKRKKKLKDN